MVVSHDAEDSLMMKVEEDRNLRLDKEKVMRKLAFYEEYADDQLSRILISLLKEQKKTEIHVHSVTESGAGSIDKSGTAN